MITKSFTFTNNTTIDPDEVNQNFDDLIAEIKGAHHSDADGTAILPVDIGSGWGLIPRKGIIAFNDALENIPAGYVLCDGNNDTPNLVGRFIQGAGTGYDLGGTGGSATMAHTHTFAHSHTYSGTTSDTGINYFANAGDENEPAARNTHTHTYSGTTSGASTSTTSGASNTENRPPFTNLPFIMKT